MHTGALCTAKCVAPQEVSSVNSDTACTRLHLDRDLHISSLTAAQTPIRFNLRHESLLNGTWSQMHSIT